MPPPSSGGASRIRSRYARHTTAASARANNSRPPSTMGPTGCSASSNSVTTPKLPPPPLRPQKSSVFSAALAVTQPAVGRDDLGRKQVVAGQPVQPLEPAAAAAEDESGNAGAGDAPAGGGQTEGLCLAVELAPREASLRAHAPRGGVHAHALHRSQVQQQAPFDGGVAGHRVPAPAHRERHAALAREVDGGDHIVSTRGARDHPGPAIERGVEAGPGSVEARAIGRCEHLSAEARAQKREVDHARQRMRRRALCAVPCVTPRENALAAERCQRTS